MSAALEDLQVTYEQMQTSLETVEVIQEDLFQQTQFYQSLFQFFPIAALVTDANGLILEANQEIARLLNVPHSYLVDKPLAVFVAENDRATFRTRLIELSESTDIQIWQTRLCSHQGEPVRVELHFSIVRNAEGRIEQLRIGVYNLSQPQEILASARSSVASSQRRDSVPTRQSMSQLPQSLDGLRVLVVDDEADICEFVATVLEAHGIGVKTVTSAAAALEEFQQFRPDILLSDIRMPDEDGYSFIQRVRALEAEQGGHVPAVAMTAYLDEDREKALSAGFEAYLHKMVQPREWIEIVAQFARRF
ncbi:response regulator [Leptolyngbya sp. AN10]